MTPIVFLILAASHYVVHFMEDDCIACIPKRSIVAPHTPVNGLPCTVKWSDNIEYVATVLAMGKCMHVDNYVCCTVKLQLRHHYCR